MRLLVLLAIGGLGAVAAAWGMPRGGRIARFGALAGVAALIAITVAAFLLRPGRLTDTGQPITGAFDAHLVGTVYLRLVVGLWGIESLILLFAAWLLGGLPRLRGLLPATLAAMTGGTVAMASADLAIGASAAAATGLASLLVVLRAEGPAAVAAGARELRVTLVTGAVLVGAMVVVPLAARLALIAAGVGSDEEAVQAASSVAGPAMGLVALAMGLALAARWGMLPLHVRVSRLTDLVPPETLPLLLGWAAVPFTVVTLAAIDRLVAPVPLALDGERVLLVLLALTTLGGASLAAFFHDDLRHATGYLVIADAGLLLLAIAALDPAAWGAGRAWVVVLAASKTALGAWAAVTEDRFETRSIPELRGWMRRSPLLAVSLGLTALATFGLPGWVALEARTGLATAAAPSPWRELLVVAGFLTLPTYLRLLRVGVGRVTSHVDRAAPERIVRRRRPLETLVVEHEGAAVADRPRSMRGRVDAARPRGDQPEAGATLEPSEAREASVHEPGATGRASAARASVAGGLTRGLAGARGAAGRARAAASESATSMRDALSRPARPGDASDADPADAPADRDAEADPSAGRETGDWPARPTTPRATGVSLPARTGTRRPAVAGSHRPARPIPEPTPAPDPGAGPETPPDEAATDPDDATGPKRPPTRRAMPADSGARSVSISTSATPEDLPGTGAARRRRAGMPAGAPSAWSRAQVLGSRFAAALRRDRTELLSGAVLALAILAVLTSWGALDLSGAAAEPAPIILSGSSD